MLIISKEIAMEGETEEGRRRDGGGREKDKVFKTEQAACAAYPEMLPRLPPPVTARVATGSETP